MLDGAGYHTTPLTVPEGIRLIYLPPYTPELQPAETLWVHVDEPIVNKHFERPSTTSTLSWRRASPWKKTATSSGGRPDSTGG